jgi:hypothetical protein
VPATASLKDIKRQYRRLSLNLHPDKIQTMDHLSHQRKQEEEVRYEAIKVAYETVNSENRRALYDRFGSQILRECPHCKVRNDYLQFGLQQTLGFYMGTFMVSVIVGLLTRRMAWMRYYLLAWLLTAELYFTCTRAEGSFLGRPSFEWIDFLRHSVIAASLLVMQLINIWSVDNKVDWSAVLGRTTSLTQEMEGWINWQRKDLDQEKLNRQLDVTMKKLQSPPVPEAAAVKR